MFLKKFAAIKNVGRFKSARISGGEYGHFTLIYGGNGRGKTTFCSILRSLQQGDPAFIQRRKTFRADSEPEVTVLLDSGPVKFANGSWDTTQPDIHIFDQHFVNENVHGGEHVGVEQRRNFYRVVVGATGVALAGEVDALDADVASKQTEIATAKRILEQHLPAGMKLEPFLKLKAKVEIDKEIENAEKTLSAINNSAAIESRKLLSVPRFLALPNGFIELLEKGVDGVSADATERVRQQLAGHQFREGGEAWLSEGLSHAVDEHCPFCATSLVGNSLIDAYRGYFSEAYTSHKIAITEMETTLTQSLSSTEALKLEQAFGDAASDAEFWKRFCNIEYEPSGAANRISIEVEALLDSAKAMLEAKKSSPLEPVEASAEFLDAQEKWSATIKKLEAEFDTFREANRLIQNVKDVNATADKANAEAVLATLKAEKKRHSEPVLSLATNYENLKSEKTTLVAKKKSKKEALDKHDNSILGGYEADINRFLSSFGVSFRLAQFGKNYVGKVPQSTYYLRFDSSDVDVTKTSGDDPGFDTTMSAGDKSTLALAFFLSQIARDPDIKQKMIVFDDPFTSLDDFRRTMTAKEIVRAGATDKAAQVIVLSHDKYFLDTVSSQIYGPSCTPFQISACASGSSIEPWNLEKEVTEGYLQDHLRLQEFVEGRGGNARDMRMIMRPLLERYIRYRFPNLASKKEWLGDMIGAIRADITHPLTPQYNELEDINSFTAPFHHDPNTPFDSDEVRAYARRTVAIVGGC